MNMSTGIHFTDNQWALIKPCIPKPKRMGRPRADDHRTLEAILWVDKTGARWQDLPKEYGDDSTANRRLLQWQDQGVWDTIWQAALQVADEQGLLDLTQTNLAATFAPAKGGGDGVGLTRKGKGTKTLMVSEANSLPLSVSVAAADEAETALALPTVDKIRIPKRRGRPQTRPRRICGDKAYDSMPLRREFRRRGITANFPERVSAKRKRRRKGPKPKCPKVIYAQRYKVERTFAWLGYFRRLLVRWERKLSAFLGFVNFTCMFMLIRKVAA
jgi:transposase